MSKLSLIQYKDELSRLDNEGLEFAKLLTSRMVERGMGQDSVINSNFTYTQRLTAIKAVITARSQKCLL